MCTPSPAHLLDEDLADIPVVVEGGQMQRGEAVLLLNVHQLPRSAQDLLCGPAVTTDNTKLNQAECTTPSTAPIKKSCICNSGPSAFY